MDENDVCLEHKDEILWSCAMCSVSLCKSCGAVAFSKKVYCKECISKIDASQSLFDDSEKEYSIFLSIHHDIKFNAIIIVAAFFFLSSFSAMFSLVRLYAWLFWILFLSFSGTRFVVDGFKIAGLFEGESQRQIKFSVRLGACLFFIAVVFPFFQVLFRNGILKGHVWSVVASMQLLSCGASFLLMGVLMLIFIRMSDEEFSPTILFFLMYATPAVLFPFFSNEFVCPILSF